ncbi:MAG TPA: hypothetical protein VD816_08940 [Ohtaekwangia sp.]|nr:hypothetical protein [Ohtaekwangia sp.]
MKHIVYILLLVLCGCSSSTEITGSWRSNNTPKEGIDNILVTALSSKTAARQTVENDLANILQKNGFKTVKSIDILPPSFTDGKEPDKEVILDKIKGNDIDAILTVALIDKETENRYVPGSTGYAPVPRFDYYGRFWGYYSTWYPTLHSPGYYTEDKVYFIETNLYDADTEELLWSAQSETYNPASLESFSKEFASVMAEQMAADGVLRMNGNPVTVKKE